ACARINPGARRAGVLSPEAQRHDDDRPTAGSNSKTSPASHGLTKVCTDSLLEEGGFEPSVPPWGQDLPTPARRRLRCQSRASSPLWSLLPVSFKDLRAGPTPWFGCWSESLVLVSRRLICLVHEVLSRPMRDRRVL